MQKFDLLSKSSRIYANMVESLRIIRRTSGEMLSIRKYSEISNFCEYIRKDSTSAKNQSNFCEFFRIHANLNKTIRKNSQKTDHSQRFAKFSQTDMSPVICPLFANRLFDVFRISKNRKFCESLRYSQTSVFRRLKKMSKFHVFFD